MDKNSIEQEAIKIVEDEINKWEDAEVQVTEKVRFRARDLIRTCRKNYYGFFDKPVDPITGKKRFFSPLTEEMCDSIAPKIGIETKNVDMIATNPEGYITAEITRLGAKKFLRENYVGEIQDEDTLALTINGTVVRKTWMKGKKIMTRDVDLLNIFIDPTAKSIQDAYRFTERAVMFKSDIAKTGWMNADKVQTSEEVPRIDLQRKNTNTEGVPQVDVYDLWGKIPKYLITGKKADTEEVDGHIIVSGLESGSPLVHKIELNPNKDKFGNAVKPYEEGWYIRVPGRWYGKGVAEKLIGLQIYMNLIINIRITRATLAQMGILKIRKGSNITSAQVAKMGVNGTISVNSMDDIEQLVIQEASQSSYTDEENIRSLAQRLTSAFETVTGEGLPASTPATNAMLSSRAAMGTFTQIQQRQAMYVARWIDRQWLPRFAQTLDTKEVLILLGDDAKFDILLERVAVAQVKDALYSSNRIPTEQALVQAVETLKETYRKSGSIFIKDLKDLIISAVDVRVQTSSEEIDPAIVTDKLISTLQIAPQYADTIIKEIYNLMGLTMPVDMLRPNPVQMGPDGQPLVGQGAQQPLQQLPGAGESMMTQTQDALTGQLANRS